MSGFPSCLALRVRLGTWSHPVAAGVKIIRPPAREEPR
jgi:hypothetical protein